MAVGRGGGWGEASPPPQSTQLPPQKEREKEEKRERREGKRAREGGRWWEHVHDIGAAVQVISNPLRL